LYPVRPSVAEGAFHETLSAERSAFPQFPMKREGASTFPTGAEVADSDAEGCALGVSDSTAGVVGAGFAASSPSFPPERTNAAKSTIPTSTAKITRGDVPCFGLADGFSVEREAETAGRFAAGVVETLTRSREPVVGTGGTTNFVAVEARFADFLVADFLTARFAVVFFAVVFFAADFLATDFLTARFVTFFVALFFTARFAVVFFAADFLATDFLATFLAALFFLTATLTPWIAVCVNRRTRTGISLA
jgi:hypothetical protein